MNAQLHKLWWLFWLLYLGLVLLLTLGPGVVDSGVQGGDKIAHLAAFFLLVVGAPWPVRGRGILAAIAVTVIIGGTIEVLQHSVPAWNRSGDLYDFLADLAGATFGLGLRLSSMRSLTA